MEWTSGDSSCFTRYCSCLFIATSGRWAAAWWGSFSEMKKENPVTALRSIFSAQMVCYEIIKPYWWAAVCTGPLTYYRELTLTGWYLILIQANIEKSIYQPEPNTGATCARRTHKLTHRWGADFVVLSLKDGAVRLRMELSLKTKSKMRSRCRIPSACWLRKTKAKIDREKKERPLKTEGKNDKRTDCARGRRKWETEGDVRRWRRGIDMEESSGICCQNLQECEGEREARRTQTQAASSLTSAEVSAQTSLSSSPRRLCSGADIVLSTTKRPPNWWAKRFGYQSIARRVAKILTCMHRPHKGAHYCTKTHRLMCSLKCTFSLDCTTPPHFYRNTWTAGLHHQYCWPKALQHKAPHPSIALYYFFYKCILFLHWWSSKIKPFLLQFQQKLNFIQQSWNSKHSIN